MFRTLNSRLTILLFSIGLLSGVCGQGATIEVTANLTGNVTWRNTNEYVLNGFIYVLAGGVLNIEPGTVIRGKAGTGLSSSALFITQGAKIFANGTRAKPIIFCSENDDLDDPTDIPLWQRGLWGGIVLYGNAILNNANDLNGRGASPKYDIFEGLPDTAIGDQHINRYGGNDDNDSSGVMRYCSIRNSSTVILPDKEINALSLCGVGRGTKIENIEMVGAADDSVEFFGGTVNTKYMASIFSDDDNFDIDEGYRGKNQFWFAVQAPDKKDNGGEWNGEPNGIGAGNTPIGNFEIYNATYIGAGTNTTGARALISRVYAAPKVLNSIFTEFNIGVNIDTTSAIHFTNDVARLQNNIFWNFAANGVAAPYWQNPIAEWVMTNSANSNLFVDPMLTSISRTNVPAFQLDPRPQPGSPALSSPISAPDDGFYTPVAYIGAFKDVNWASDWGFAAELCLITGEAAGTPHAPTGGTIADCTPANLTITLVGGMIEISFASETGHSYQVQSSTTLDGSPIGWANEGSSLTGTGGTVTFTIGSGDPQRFFQVICH